MIQFAWPYFFLLLPLPWLIYRFFPPSRFNENAALKVPELNDFQHFKNPSRISLPKFRTLLAFLFWVSLLTSAARPQWVGEPVDISKSGRDLMLAVDLSGSMQIKDFKINGKITDRLTALKLVTGDFIDRRKGDRIGLILFGSNAYLQTPLTFDTSTVKQLLMESEVGLAGAETAIGDAIGLAVKHLKNSSAESRVLIVLTDGNNNAGELSLERAAELAAHAKVKIHTVAIGSKNQVVQTIFGARMTQPSAEIDEKALKMVAETTGGQYFLADDSSDFSGIYHAINSLMALEHAFMHYCPIDEVFHFPICFTLMCVLLAIFSFIIRRSLWRL